MMKIKAKEIKVRRYNSRFYKVYWKPIKQFILEEINKAYEMVKTDKKNMEFPLDKLSDEETENKFYEAIKEIVKKHPISTSGLTPYYRAGTRKEE